MQAMYALAQKHRDLADLYHKVDVLIFSRLLAKNMSILSISAQARSFSLDISFHLSSSRPRHSQVKHLITHLVSFKFFVSLGILLTVASHNSISHLAFPLCQAVRTTPHLDLIVCGLFWLRFGTFNMSRGVSRLLAEDAPTDEAAVIEASSAFYFAGHCNVPDGSWSSGMSLLSVCQQGCSTVYATYSSTNGKCKRHDTCPTTSTFATTHVHTSRQVDLAKLRM